jgi:hypothetical protein
MYFATDTKGKNEIQGSFTPFRMTTSRENRVLPFGKFGSGDARDFDTTKREE